MGRSIQAVQGGDVRINASGILVTLGAIQDVRLFLEGLDLFGEGGGRRKGLRRSRGNGDGGPGNRERGSILSPLVAAGREVHSQGQQKCREWRSQERRGRAT